MSHDARTDLPSMGHPEFDRLLGESRAWLGDRGELVVGSGTFQAGRFSVALHSDFGPIGQDKGTNQDYALAWRSKNHGAPQQPRFVLALGDGLTNSFQSECGAALACWLAVRTLVESKPRAEPHDLARTAFNEAGQAIGRLVDELALDPEASCPEGQFVATWKYILKKGRLFQTTLTLAWLDRDHFYIAMVGDGGALWRAYCGPRTASQPADRVLASCNLDSQQVYALGPADRTVQAFDCWHAEELNGAFLCALSTDGIGRAHDVHPTALLDELERLHAAGIRNPAQRFIEQAIEKRPHDFDDNLTLAVIQAE